MRVYEVKTVNTLDWNKIDKAYIDSYTWGNEYTPVSYGQLAILENKGIAVRLTSYEKQPKALYKNYNDPVYKDSCLEFFASFNNESPVYLNFEANSNGAFLAAVRTSRKNKTPIDKIINIEEINIKAETNDDFWFVEYIIPFEMIEKLFGGKSFDKGVFFKGNFYKCGDETAIPHFGSFFPINLPEPDFHCPQFFGKFIIQ